jgi:hypothetical protein
MDDLIERLIDAINKNTVVINNLSTKLSHCETDLGELIDHGIDDENNESIKYLDGSVIDI